MSNRSYRKGIKHIEGLGHLRELTFSCYMRKPRLTNNPWRRILARYIDDACDDEGFGLVAFVFMPEHVHLLAIPLDRETSKVSRLSACFVEILASLSVLREVDSRVFGIVKVEVGHHRLNDGPQCFSQ